VTGGDPRGVLGDGALQLEQSDGQTVDEHDDVRPPGVACLGDRELVGGQPVVAGGVVEVEDADGVVADGPVRTHVLDADAVDQVVVQLVVGVDRLRGGDAGHLPEGLVEALGGDPGVESGERGRRRSTSTTSAYEARSAVGSPGAMDGPATTA
jgi:hypothetical protein